MSKRIYFLSDFHLGLDGVKSSAEREGIIVDWLDSIKENAEKIYLLGDVFDYWFEYSQVIPKGFHRLLSKLQELSEKGIQMAFFTGNHDMWMFRYFEDHMNIPIHRGPLTVEHFGYKLFLAHGDGLGPGDYGYKFIKAIFSNRICQWLFARIHPNLGIRMMKFFSQKSRSSQRDERFHGPEKERLIIFFESFLSKENYDFFICGHRHLPIDYTLANGVSRYINLGDWINYYSYAVLDEKGLQLKFAFDENQTIYGN